MNKMTSKVQYTFLSIALYWNEIETWGRLLMCSSRQDTSNNMRLDQFRSIRDLDLG